MEDKILEMNICISCRAKEKYLNIYFRVIPNALKLQKLMNSKD